MGDRGLRVFYSLVQGLNKLWRGAESARDRAESAL